MVYCTDSRPVWSWRARLPAVYKEWLGLRGLWPVPYFSYLNTSGASKAIWPWRSKASWTQSQFLHQFAAIIPKISLAHSFTCHQSSPSDQQYEGAKLPDFVQLLGNLDPNQCYRERRVCLCLARDFNGYSRSRSSLAAIIESSCNDQSEYCVD